MYQNTLSDAELRDADMDTRRWWARVYTLVNDTGCTIEQAILAVRAADQAGAE